MRQCTIGKRSIFPAGTNFFRSIAAYPCLASGSTPYRWFRMPPPITCVADLRELARKRVPRAFFDYDDRGSYDEVTLRDNRAVFERIRLRQRVMIDVDQRDLSTDVVGQPLSMPLAIAPTGLTGLTHGSGEILAARAAAAAGIPFCLSTMSICSVEQVAAAVTAPLVSDLRDARSGLHEIADHPRTRGRLLGLDGHGRPADPGTAPSRDQERDDGTAETHPGRTSSTSSASHAGSAAYSPHRAARSATWPARSTVPTV